MTTIEKSLDTQEFERTISESFAGGEMLCRELRLTQAQADYVSRAYPTTVHPMGGAWYEITFQGAAINYGT